MPTGEWKPPEAGDAPEKVKAILKAVYSACRDKQTGDIEDPAKKESCAKQAWGAVHNAGWSKDSDGKWAYSEKKDMRIELKAEGGFLVKEEDET